MFQGISRKISFIVPNIFENIPRKYFVILIEFERIHVDLEKKTERKLRENFTLTVGPFCGKSSTIIFFKK